jgi:hypothetical protein
MIWTVFNHYSHGLINNILKNGPSVIFFLKGCIEGSQYDDMRNSCNQIIFVTHVVMLDLILDLHKYYSLP